MGDFIGTVPDRAYGQVFGECVEFCKKTGAFDPKTMGACPNVGLMAQKGKSMALTRTPLKPSLMELFELL